MPSPPAIANRGVGRKIHLHVTDLAAATRRSGQGFSFDKYFVPDSRTHGYDAEVLTFISEIAITRSRDVVEQGNSGRRPKGRQLSDQGNRLFRRAPNCGRGQYLSLGICGTGEGNRNP